MFVGDRTTASTSLAGAAAVGGCCYRKLLRYSYSSVCKFVPDADYMYTISIYERQNVTFGRMLLPYKAQPVSARLPVLQEGGHSSLSNG